MLRRLEAENSVVAVTPKSLETYTDLIEAVRDTSDGVVRAKCKRAFENDMTGLASTRPQRSAKLRKQMHDETYRHSIIIELNKKAAGQALASKKEAIGKRSIAPRTKDVVVVGKRALEKASEGPSPPSVVQVVPCCMSHDAATAAIEVERTRCVRWRGRK